jgi:hypothetical protein
MIQTSFADVLSVRVTGNPGGYQFGVEITSPDTGCEQYADWWEVISEDGELLYRRILLHSHVNEQPFVRSGGPMEIQANSIVYIRAHMSTAGYAGRLLRDRSSPGSNPSKWRQTLGPSLNDSRRNRKIVLSDKSSERL